MIPTKKSNSRLMEEAVKVYMEFVVGELLIENNQQPGEPPRGVPPAAHSRGE